MNTPRLSHSQNFLHSPALVRKLIQMTNIRRDDLAIEIGPGRGIITRQLARVCRKVIGIECDPGLYDRLQAEFGMSSNVAIRCRDFLTYRLPRCRYKILASIPFNITSAIVAHITSGPSLPEDAYLVMQEEAARRYAGRPYARESLRSLLLKPRFEVRIVHRLASTDFKPAPACSAVFMHMHRRPAPLLSDAEYRSYKDFLSFAFAQRGRQIGERLGMIFTKRQLDRLSREWGFPMGLGHIDLSLAQWLGVFRCYSTGVSPKKRRTVRGGRRSTSRARPQQTALRSRCPSL